MEDINPTLILLLSVCRGMERGETIRHTLLMTEFPKDLQLEVQAWKIALDSPVATAAFYKTIPSLYRRHLYQLFERGLKGESIYQFLQGLEKEIVDACKLELEEKISKLPFLMLIPLMLFQFPALILVTLGPFFLEMLESMGGQFIQ